MKSRNILAILAALLFVASSAQAGVVIGGSDGWSFSTDGQINIFGVYQTGDDVPDNIVNPFLGATDQEGFRLKSGFLPACVAFNIKAPTMGGLDMAGRIGFYPEPANANVKNTFDGQIDLREIFFTVDGNFGQVLAGKALSLFLGQNLLTEMTLLGAGRMAGNLNANVGPTLGRIGYGYVYPNFNAQLRYTTPSLNGLKLAVGIYDPSVISGGGTDTPSVSATETTLPRIESELSYAGTFNSGNYKVYMNNLWQEAKGDFGDVTAWGFGGGAVVSIGAFELSGSGFTGEALGRSLMLDTEALDETGEERETWGYIVQGTYTMDNPGKTKFGVSYGGNEFEETSWEKGIRDGGGDAEIESQYMLTLMVSHDINANLKLVAEVSHIELEWFNGEDWKVEQMNLGAFFLW